jgi:hypothetical protein
MTLKSKRSAIYTDIHTLFPEKRWVRRKDERNEIGQKGKREKNTGERMKGIE